MKVLAREIPLFVLVGLAATLINYVAALVAHHSLAAGPMLAGCVGYLSAVGVSYLGNSHLTFRRPVLHGPQFVRFAVISLSGFALNISLVGAGTHLLGWPLARALVPVVIVVPVATFLMSKFWAFRTPLAEPAPANAPP